MKHCGMTEKATPIDQITASTAPEPIPAPEAQEAQAAKRGGTFGFLRFAQVFSFPHIRSKKGHLTVSLF